MTALAESLAAAMDADHPTPTDDAARTAYRIDGPSSAGWAMRKLAAARTEQARIRALAAAEIERVQAWAAAEHERHERDAAWFEGLLARWALDLRAADPHCKSVTTPWGVVQTREQPGKWTVDDDTVLEWAQTARPDLIRVERSLRLADARKVLTVTGGQAFDEATGEVVPGIDVGPVTVTATVRLATGATGA